MADQNMEKIAEERVVEEPFTMVKGKKSQKRKLDDSVSELLAMDTSEPEKKRPLLPPTSCEKSGKISKDVRKVHVPQNRFTPLKQQWMKIFTPVVEHLHLQIRFNLKSRNVEIKACKDTKEANALQKAADFVRAFTYGFAISDALALIRLDELYLETFNVKDVKFSLRGDHLGRAVGRLAGKSGRTKFTIENVSKTRIVIADTKVHILGSYKNIAIARQAISNLILGRTPAKVYGNMRGVAARASSSF